MEKLSQAGRLYLKEFYILQEAQSDLFSFLNEVTEKTYQHLQEKLEHLPAPQNFTWYIWKNKTSPGLLEISIHTSKNLGPFKKDKTELHLQCLDVRHARELIDTDAVSIRINSTNNLRKKLKQFPKEILNKAIEEAMGQETLLDFEQRVNYTSQVKLNFESATESADTITDFVIECCESMETLVSRLIEYIGPQN